MVASFLKKQRHALAILPFLIATAWFFLLEKKILIPEFFIETQMDDRIPFVPAFVIPYVVWYFYIAGVMALCYLTDPAGFVRVSLFLGLGMAVSCCVFALFPNGQLLRPHYVGHTMFGRMIGAIYSADTPTNSLPSIHVIYSLGIHFAVARHRFFARPLHPVKIVSLALATLICVSTVAIKQHSVLDVLAGLIVSAGLYGLIYGRRAQTFAAQPHPLRVGMTGLMAWLSPDR